jgi:hypothetical protein
MRRQCRASSETTISALGSTSAATDTDSQSPDVATSTSSAAAGGAGGLQPSSSTSTDGAQSNDSNDSSAPQDASLPALDPAAVPGSGPSPPADETSVDASGTTQQDPEAALISADSSAPDSNSLSSDTGVLVVDATDDAEHEISLSSDGTDLSVTVNGETNTYALASVTSIQVNGAADQNDTLTVDTTKGAIPVTISYSGGARGYDTLSVIASSVASSPSGPQSGTITADGTRILYDGLEPIAINAAVVVINGADTGGINAFTDALNNDFLRIGPCDGSACPSGDVYVKNFDPTGTFEIAELHHFVISSATTSVTINGGLGTDKVEIEGSITLPSGANLTINAETIKVLSGFTVNVGTGAISFNAITQDNGLSIVGITTTIPVLGASALIDLDSATLIGAEIKLIAAAGSLRTTAVGAQTLSGSGDTLTVASVSGFPKDNGSLTAIVNGSPTTCTYTARTADYANNVFTFTGVAGCTGSVAADSIVRKDILESGSDTGLRHAALDLEYHANVNVHGASLITASGDVTMSSSVDVTAKATAGAGADKGDWVSGSNYTKGDVVKDTADGKKYAATSDILNSTTAPHDDDGLLGKWTKAEQKDSSVVASFVLATSKTQLSDTSSITAVGNDVALGSSVKTSVESTADSALSSSGAAIAVIVLITSSEAFVDSNAATPVTADTLTISADTDNSGPTTAKAAPAGAEDNDTNTNSPSQNATTKVAGGGQSLGATLNVATTGGFTDSGNFTGDGITGTCAYTGRTATSFTGISGCSGTPDDGAQIKSDASSSKQSQGANGKADGQSNTAEGQVGLVGAFAVSFVLATTSAYVAPTNSASTHTLNLGSLHKIHAGTKNNSSAKGDASPANGGPGVGVGVGINITILTTEAYIANNAVVNATTITIEALAPASGSSTTNAEAKSGAGGTSGLTFAGALAVNVLVADTTAEVRAPTAVTLNGNVSLTAISGFTNTAKAEANGAGGSTGIGASVAVNVVDDTTVAQVEDGAVLNGVHDLTLTATSNDSMTTTANGGQDPGGTSSSFSLGFSAAISISNITTNATIGTGGLILLTGKLDSTATQTASVTATAKGASSGGNVGIGAAITVTLANHLVDALIKRSLTATGNITMKALGTSTVTSSATASSKGAKGEGGDSSGKNTNQKGDDQLNLGKGKSKDTSTGSTPKNGTGEGGNGSSVSVGAAIVFNMATSRAMAHIGIDSGSVTVTGALISLLSKADSDASATADGKAANGGTATIGVAVALNLVKVTNEASIDAAANIISSGGLSLCAGMATTCGAATSNKHVFEANATSGAGGGGTIGVAGSVAINIVDVKTLAVIHAHPNRGPPSVTVTGTGDVAFKATSTAENKAITKADQEGGGGTLGAGASVSINLVNDTTQAGLEDAADAVNFAVLDATAVAHGPNVTGARDITISATQKETLTTEATGGAGGASVAINPNVAIVIANLSAKASIGRGASLGAVHPAAGLTGKIEAKADQAVTATTTAKGAVTAGSGTDVGIALSLALAIIDASSDSSSRRSLHAAGPISFQADGNVSSTSTAEASAKGAKKDGENTNQKADKNLSQAKNTQQTNTGKSTSKSETPKTTTGDSGGQSLSVAGAFAINVITTSSTATLANGSTVRSDSGAVTLKTSANTDASAKGKGDTATDASVGIGAGVAVNSVDITNRASTGSATINSVGLDVQATMRDVSGNMQHLIEANAYAGASKTSDVGLAGALALNIVVNHTEAVVNAGANATSTGGAVTLNAVSDEKDIANASGKVEGGGSSVGVGAAVAINLLTPSVVRAEAEDTAGLTLTSGTTITVTANGNRVVETSVTAGTKGDTAITPAVALVIDKDDSVTARLGTSGTSLSGSGAATITATHTGDFSKTKADATAAGSSV